MQQRAKEQQPQPGEPQPTEPTMIDPALAGRLSTMAGMVQKGGPFAIVGVFLWLMVDGVKDDVNVAVDSVKDDVSSVRSDVGNVQLALGAKLDDLRSQLSEIDKRVEVMNTETASLPDIRKTLANLQASARVVEEHIDALERSLGAIQADVNRHDALPHHETAGVKLGELERRILELERRRQGDGN